jgi:hypothetical protein
VTGVLAVPAGGRVVVVCCGGHRPGGDCGCCLECPATTTAPAELLALLASGARAHDASLRMALRRAFHAVCAAAVDDHLRGLAAATAAAVHALTPDLPHLEGSLT